MRNGFVIGLVATLVVATAGCGSDDTAAGGGEPSIRIEMRDNVFSPQTVTVQAGQRVRFTFENVGDEDHEAILGDEDFQADHEQEMNPPATAGEDSGGTPSSSTRPAHETSDDMEHGSMGANGITVKPGETGELSRTFGAGDDGILIGCHEPGHYPAGMLITVSVA